MRLNNTELLKFALSFADISKSILQKNYFKKFNIEEKNDGSLVTNIDKEIEEKFRKHLKRKFPEHGIIGEEFGYEKEDNEYVWILDPLDGTHSFIAGKPLFGTLICCMKNNRPIIGLIDIPILNQRWFGGEKLGVKLNNVKCNKVNNKKKINQTIMASTSLLMFDKNSRSAITNIYKRVKFPIFGTDCYAYGLLLSGKIDLIVEANMKPWDYMAQVALINEIGGVITDWNGKKLGIHSDGKIIASNFFNHHKLLMDLIKKNLIK
ncbi:MAG: histidinol-phosphatase [Alphaproteobacteria bacterium]|jgi:inositol-phosphate phosphatase/L-galactose 1-phosphate phosphatase/histidinol-phosphatase|nr:histidinol-phosphatase [Alphaproteobacteria bacterium]